MDINSLRVFNSIYKLEITEKEFQDIETEQKQEHLTGLYIATTKKVKDKKVIIGVSHDEKHQIIIKEIKGQFQPKPKNRVLFKTLIKFKDLPREIYTLHNIAQYRALDTAIKYEARTLEELKDRVCDRFADGYIKTLGEMYEDSYGAYEERERNAPLRIQLVEEQLKALFWIFNEEFKGFKPTRARENISRITKVFQRNNRRLAIIQENEKWDKGGGFLGGWKETIERTTFKIQTFLPSDERYNYVVPNREIYLRGSWNEKSSIWLSEQLFEKISVEELKVLSRRFEDEGRDRWIYLTPDSYNRQKRGIRVELMNAKREDEKEHIKKRLTNKIRSDFKRKKVIVRHNITFTPKSITYEGVTLKGKELEKFITEQQILYVETPVFNEIYEGFIDFILEVEPHYDRDYEAKSYQPTFQNKTNISIGKITFNLEADKIYWINGLRIRKEDVREVLKKAICYNKQTDYDKYLQQVSRVNLSLQQALNDGGFSFELLVDKTDDSCLLRDKEENKMLLVIPLIRENNKNYAIINEQKYKIQNINALFDLETDSSLNYQQSKGYVQRTIKLLYRGIKGITAKEIGVLIQNGTREYRRMTKKKNRDAREIILRSKEFIANAVKLTNAKKVKGGYFVKGISKQLYFVDEKSLEVWTLEKGKKKTHLCIIDNDYEYDGKDNTAIQNDRVAKRLLMLAQDKKVAKEIYDKGDKMEDYWIRIQDLKEDAEGVII